ncbi:MAG: tRNA (adenosine(37)-N6)-threonylcarbamoyltransferase complex dimerization subunit type 1 TsaB [bacterium]|nr:tRNA (adenosine(37)-N6)-threonylcarbamoyltransferase complex dimerization subunit type 1 TsaB [bacterium]
MKSLYINTVEKNLSLGFKDGDKFNLVESSNQVQQSEKIFPLISEALGKNKISDLDFIVCLSGPGSFTGIRLGLSVVKGFNIAVGVPVITLNNFTALLYSVMDEVEKKGEDFYIAIPSGMSELFVAKFSCDGKLLEEGKLVKKENFHPLEFVYFDLKVNVEKVLLQVEKTFDKSTFEQKPIEPTYIKPHYAKVKAK